MKKLILILLSLCTLLSAECINNSNGTVSCKDTGLMWQDNADVGKVKKTWKDAIEYCKNLSLAGYFDWRLPNIRELISITDRLNSYKPSLKQGFKQRSSNFFWSSTTSAFNTSDAWGVFFDRGDSDNSRKSDGGFVRCTR